VNATGAGPESQVAQSALDQHESQVAQSAVDKYESQVAQSAVDKYESQVAQSAVDKYESQVAQSALDQHKPGCDTQVAPENSATPNHTEIMSLAEPSVALQVLMPTRIGRYRILRKLGQGGMGAVYLGERDDGEFAQTVAIKTLLPALSNSSQVLSRLLAERQILAKLNHPAIAQLLDGGTDAAGVPYLVMEYIDGVKIDQFVATQNYASDAIVRLFINVCDAVSAAHELLIVHRDIKPENVLIDANGRPKLLDFGIAKVLSEDPSLMDSKLHTDTGFSPMTQRYASPEQIRGDTISTASDVYALGVLLYELLTGVSPYRDEDLQGMKIIGAITEYDPPAPSKRLSPELRSRQTGARRITSDLDAILLKALRKDPQARYRSVAMFARDLEAFLKQEPISAHRGSSLYRAQRFMRRHWLVSLATATSIGFLGVSAWSLNSQLQQAQKQREAGLQTTEFLRELFVPNSYAFASAPESTAQRLELARKRVLQGFSEQPQVRAGLLVTLAKAFLNTGEIARAAELIAEAKKQAMLLPPLDQQRLALWEIELQLAQGNFAQAKILLARITHADTSLQLALTQARFSASYALGELENARKGLDQWEGILREANAPLHPLWLQRAELELALGDGEKCLKALSAQPETLTATLATEFELPAGLLRAQCLWKLSRESAREAFERAVDSHRLAYGLNSVPYAQALAASTEFLLANKQFLDADTQNARVREILRHNERSETLGYVAAIRRSAQLLKHRGQTKAARAQARLAMDLLDQLATASTPTQRIFQMGEHDKLAALLL
jgi:serine/threonine protein kinase